jgi:hypothetical protein
MPDLPDHYAAAAARSHITIIGRLPRRRVEHALRSSLPTMRDAIALANALVTALGDRGWDDPSTITPSRRIHLRDTTDPTWLVPQPLLEIRRIAERTETTLGLIRTGPDLPPEDQPDDWKPGDPPWYATPRKPDIAPQGPDMFCGDLILHEGPTYYTIRYDDRGIVCGSTMCGGDLFWAARAPARMPLAVDSSHRPPESLPMRLLCRDDLEDEMSAETLAAMLLDTDQAQRIALRVWLPVDVPGGASLVPNAALVGLRRVLAQGVPADARIAVADGFAGTAVALGPTLADAMAAWRVELWRHKPGSDHAPEITPPVTEPAAPREPDPDPTADNVRALGRDVQRIDLGKHTFSFGPPASAVPLPALVPDNTPATRIAIPTHTPTIPPPWAAAGFDRWVHLVGASGSVAFALARTHPDRTTLVGEGVLDIVDPESLDARIDAEIAEQRAEWQSAYGDDPEFAHCVTAPVFARFRVWDAVRQASCFRFAGSTNADRIPYDVVDGDELGWCVACWSR